MVLKLPDTVGPELTTAATTWEVHFWVIHHISIYLCFLSLFHPNAHLQAHCLFSPGFVPQVPLI